MMNMMNMITIDPVMTAAAVSFAYETAMDYFVRSVVESNVDTGSIPIVDVMLYAKDVASSALVTLNSKVYEYDPSSVVTGPLRRIGAGLIAGAVATFVLPGAAVVPIVIGVEQLYTYCDPTSYYNAHMREHETYEFPALILEVATTAAVVTKMTAERVFRTRYQPFKRRGKSESTKVVPFMLALILTSRLL